MFNAIKTRLNLNNKDFIKKMPPDDSED